MTDADRRLDEWLRGLKWSLQSIPSPEREDIVEETRAHITERLARGAPLEEALAPFGTPEDYARSFIDEMEVSGALASQRSASLMAVIARRAHRSVVAAGAILGVLILNVIAIGAVVTGVYKLVDPAHAGLWVGPGFAFLGTTDDVTAGRELLGNWVYVLIPTVLVACWYLARLILIGTVRTFARR